MSTLASARHQPVGRNGVPPHSMADQPQRLIIHHLLNPKAEHSRAQASGQDVIQGLSQTPKTLPCHYFYDDRGSDLFEQICALPEYYLTRTETAILKDCAPQIAQITGPCELMELGSGSATKTRILLDAYQDRHLPLRYLPIDVSGGMLKQSADNLLQSYPDLMIHGLIGTYDIALQNLPIPELPSRLVCFLGSTLGNFSPQDSALFFDRLRTALNPGEYLLLGVDLQKSPQILEAAYNDSQGITAAFNLNILHHLNWRFQANFNVDQFQHWARYNQQAHQIEMYLKSLVQQSVELATIDFSVEFAAGETIRTEISRKFNLETLQTRLSQHSDQRSDASTPQPCLQPIRVWTDAHNWFGLILCQVC